MAEVIDTKLTEIFRNVFDDENIVLCRDMTAEDIENWDSLSHIDLIVLVEEAFAVKIPTEKAVGFQNVGQLIDLIDSLS